VDEGKIKSALTSGFFVRLLYGYKRMKIVAVIEARMASTRLPGKVLLESAGKPMLTHLVDRLRQVPSLDDIVLATTVNPQDEQLVSYAKAHDLAYYRGSESNVMQRVIEATESVAGDLIVEITGDCPIIDYELVEQCIALYKANHQSCDFVSNVVIPSFPDGMEVQVYPLDILKHSASLTNDPYHQEHVTVHIIQNPALYRQLHLTAMPSMHWPGLGLTLDEPDDYQLINQLIEHFGADNPYFGCQDIVSILKKKDDWYQYNANVQRRRHT